MHCHICLGEILGSTQQYHQLENRKRLRQDEKFLYEKFLHPVPLLFEYEVDIFLEQTGLPLVILHFCLAVTGFFEPVVQP